MKNYILLLFLLTSFGCSYLQSKPKVSAKSDTSDKLENKLVEKTDSIFTIKITSFTSHQLLLAKEINPSKGMADLENKWNVDIIIETDNCDDVLEEFGKGQIDAMCATNIDIAPLAKYRPLTVILPLSISIGADKLIISDTWTSSTRVYGESRTISDYLFLNIPQNKAISRRSLTNVEEKFAAMAFANNTVQAVAVRDPYASFILFEKPESKAIVSTGKFKDEFLLENSDVEVIAKIEDLSIPIIDYIVIGNDILSKPNGDKFASCLCELYFQSCANLENDQEEKFLKFLGTLWDIKQPAPKDVLTNVKLFSPTDAVDHMSKITMFTNIWDNIDVPVNDTNKTLNFDVQYIQKLKILD